VTFINEYNFKEQYKKGNKHARFLDEHYSKVFHIEVVSKFLEKLGIDRIFTHLKTGAKNSIEYKADERAATTGNIFVETISVDTTKTLGWAYTSCAQWLMIYIPEKNIVYHTTPIHVRQKIEEWQEMYKTVTIPNEGYNTIGICVPEKIFETVCWRTEIIHKLIP